MEQTINLTNRIDFDLVDSGAVNFTFSAYMGGSGTEDDSTGLILTFIDANKQIVQPFAELYPILAIDRDNVTSLVHQTVYGTVPPYTRSINVLVIMARLAGAVNNAAVDNISLILYM